MLILLDIRIGSFLGLRMSELGSGIFILWIWVKALDFSRKKWNFLFSQKLTTRKKMKNGLKGDKIRLSTTQILLSLTKNLRFILAFTLNIPSKMKTMKYISHKPNLTLIPGWSTFSPDLIKSTSFSQTDRSILSQAISFR